MYLYIFIAALIVFILAMTMNKNVVEGYRKWRRKARTSLKAGRRTSRNTNMLRRNLIPKKKILFQMRRKKKEAKKLFKYTKAELLKLEKKLEAANPKNPIEKLKIKAQINLGDARGTSQKRYVDIKILKDLKINTQEILENAKETRTMYKSAFDFAKKKVFKKIDKIQNIMNKNNIRKYIPKWRRRGVNSRAEDLKSGIINYYDLMVGDMNKDIIVIYKITKILKEYYDTAAKNMDEEMSHEQQNK
jgi:hypothetical protein